jgi:hypothetical protein
LRVQEKRWRLINCYEHIKVQGGYLIIVNENIQNFYIYKKIASIKKLKKLRWELNHLVGGPVIKVSDLGVCFSCGLIFEPCGY